MWPPGAPDWGGPLVYALPPLQSEPITEKPTTMSLSPLVTDTTPMTLLGAVNRVLEAARITAISTLANIESNEDAAAAKQAIDAASMEVQTEKWEFNRFPKYVITGTAVVGGVELRLPLNTLSVATSRTTPSGDKLVQVGNLLAYRTDSLTVFPAGTTATVDITLLLEFQEVPPAARMLITATAARMWALPRLPTGATFRYTEEYMTRARSLLEREDADVIDGDHASRSPHFAKHRRR